MNRIEKLIAALTSPMKSLQATVTDFRTKRDVNSAVGAQLDLIGKIVGQPRAGESDDAIYRRYIRARIAVNRSSGTPEDLIRVARLVVGVTTGKILVRGVDDATLILEIRDVPTTAAVAKVLQGMLTAAVSAGVRIIIVYSSVALSSTFRLDAGPGLDAGHLARGIDYGGTL